MALRHLISSISVLAITFKMCFGRLQGKSQAAGKLAFAEPPENMFDPALIRHPTGTFAPLDCNADLDFAPCVTTFSSYFKSDSVDTENLKFDKELVVPCGKCIVMDEQPNILDLLGGLDIQGKLLIPDGVQLKMRVTSILVQGELEIISSKPINGKPDVHILWLSTTFPVSFIPANSTDACGGEQHACDLGRKPFVVAGGKVNIRGLPREDMPTWVPLHDVEASASASDWSIPESQYKKYQALPSNCPEDGVLIEHSVATTTSSNVFVTNHKPYGVHTKQTGSSLRESNRRTKADAVVVDLKDIRRCLQPGQTYLVTAQVKVSKYGEKGRTHCAKSGNTCTKLVRKHIALDRSEELTPIWEEHKSLQTTLGQEFFLATEMYFEEEELASAGTRILLEFLGPGAGMVLEVSDLSILIPPVEAFPTPDNVCGNMVPANGDAELFERSPFPFHTNDGAVSLVVATEDSNRFFRVSGRDLASKIDAERRSNHHHNSKHKIGEQWSSVGLTWSVPFDCIKRQSTYRIHADVRVHGKEPTTVEFHIQGDPKSCSECSPLYVFLAECPPSKGDWVSCDGEFSVPKRLVKHSSRYEISIQTLGAVAADYDVDNLSFELVEGPIDQLVLPESIKDTWTEGANILLTSHTKIWNTHQNAVIKKIENNFESGYVNVQLEESILRPVTGKENPLYATEVALMSRNIVFDGGYGAHFTILHTPHVPQTIQGADFTTFGIAGERDSYPILFDNCGDSSGSLISKNTIRRSGQRCVVLHATDNVLVEGNVAHDTFGHCYALDSGAEVGNMFMNNLGAFTRSAHNLMPQFGVSGKETDDTPATFWITNPLNLFEGNVAAGSSGHGFWMPLADQPRGPHAREHQVVPSRMPISHFAGNVAHSIFGYPIKMSGYHSTKPQSIDGFRAYLGVSNDAFEFSAAQNVTIVDLVTDTPYGDAEKLLLKNASFVELLGCDDATLYLEFHDSEDVDHNATSQSESTLSAASVFNLQES